MVRRAPRCMLIVRCHDVAQRATAIRAALAADIDTLQLREPGGGGRAIYDAATTLRRWTREAAAALVVNNRIDVALAVGADGVHLPAASFSIDVARRVLGSTPWIGRSTHSPDEARAAAQAGADYVVLGPIYDTPSKRTYGAPLGSNALRAVNVSIPAIAVGGITAARVAEVVRAGASGIAVVHEILDAGDPATAATKLVAAVRECRELASRRDTHRR